MNDYASLLRPEERARLEARLADHERATGAQMAIAIFTSLEGESLEDYAHRLFQKWRLGRKSLDNGVLLVVFVQDRKLRLEVGYGLEPVLTDAAAARIIREVIAPRFREGRHAAGLGGAADAVYALIAPAGAGRAGKSAEDLRRESDAWRRNQRHHEDSARLYLILFFALVAAVVGGLAWEATRRQGVTAGRRGWQRSSGWSSGGWSGGGGGWSSGGGGGFSGGGGSSGGGGASGSW